MSPSGPVAPPIERDETLTRDLRVALRTAQLGADVGRILMATQSESEPLDGCATAIVRHLDAAFARIWTVSADGRMLELRASAGLDTHLDGGHARVPVGALEIGLTAQERAPHFTNDLQHDARARLSDPAWAVREGLVAFAGYPLLVDDEMLGVIAMFSRHTLEPETLVALASVADLVALGIRRSRAEERRTSLAEFLLEASPSLATVLDVRKTLSNLAQLAVPKLADWCAVDIVGDDGRSIEHVAVAHKDPRKVAMAEELRTRFPSSPDAKTGTANVVRTGVSELYAEIPDELLVAGAQNADHLRMLRALSIRSAMTVPLTARGRVLGAITLVYAESGLRYTKDDLRFAEELARRAAIAVDNAALYESEQSARRHADAANRAKDDFLATVSHELRTPLNAMLGWTRMLRSGDLPKEKHERALETIERNAVTQAQLIEDLLDVSRIVSGKLRLDIQSVELVDIVEQAMDALRLASEARGVAVLSSLDERVGSVTGDPHRLQQVVWNLLSNAIKFTPKGGRIHVSVERVDSSLKLTIADTGRGIPAEFLAHVFERFKQVDGAITRAYGGLGLGLAISRHIVELHGGTIHVESKGLGAGTTFTVVLPVSPIRQETHGTSSRGSSNPGVDASGDYGRRPELRGLKVLVVDDEEDARELIVSVLERCGSIVASASSAQEALAKIRADKPEILISDIGMPGEDGYALIRQVRALGHDNGADIPAAALTAYAGAGDRRKALDAGFMMHVSKPVEPAELVAVIANLTRFTVRR